jgi:hypothetical protein
MDHDDFITYQTEFLKTARDIALMQKKILENQAIIFDLIKQVSEKMLTIEDKLKRD